MDTSQDRQTCTQTVGPETHGLPIDAEREDTVGCRFRVEQGSTVGPGCHFELVNERGR
jgi:hypothetical protein